MADRCRTCSGRLCSAAYRAAASRLGSSVSSQPAPLPGRAGRGWGCSPVGPRGGVRARTGRRRPWRARRCAGSSRAAGPPPCAWWARVWSRAAVCAAWARTRSWNRYRPGVGSCSRWASSSWSSSRLACGQGGVEQGGCGVRVDVGAGVQAQQSVGALLVGAQVLVGQVQGGGDAALPGLQLAEPVLLVAQPLDQVGQVPGGVGSQPGGGDADRQRQPAAQLDKLRHQVGWLVGSRSSPAVWTNRRPRPGRAGCPATACGCGPARPAGGGW